MKFNPSSIIAEVGKLMADPNLSRLPAAGSSMSGPSTLLAGPTDTPKIQRRKEGEHWGEVDVLGTDRFNRIYVFATKEALLGVMLTEYFNADHQLSFALPGFDPTQDMLVSMASAPEAKMLTLRLWGREAAGQISSEPNIMGPMLSLADALETKNLMSHFQQTARSRGRSRLVMHVEGEDSNRLRKLTKGVGFKHHSVPGATVFTNQVGD